VSITIETVRSKRFHRLFKEGFWVVLGQTMAVLGSLVGVRLLTGFLNPAGYGELALGMTAATLVNQAILGPLGNGATRFYAPAVEEGDAGDYLNAVGRLVFLATGIIAFLILLTDIGLLLTGQTDWVGIATAALIFAILSGFNSILSGIQNAARQRSIVALHQGFESWMRFLVATGLLWCLGATSTVAMIGYAVALCLVLGSQYLFLRRVFPKHLTGANRDNHWREQIWKYSWPFSIFGMFTWAQLASDRWALAHFATTEDVGMYAVLFQLGYYPMSIVSGMTMQFWAPIFFQRAGDATDSRRTASVKSLSWRLTALTLVMTGCAAVVGFLFHAEIFQVFVAKEYRSASHLLPWMLLAGGVFAAGQTISLNLMSLMKAQAMMTAKVATAVLGVTLNFAGAYWYGTRGIVIAGVLFSLSFFVWMRALLWREGREGCL
jgi:O-antigen/teichoic acid export membrane protein